MENEVAEIRIITPVYSEEEFPELLRSAVWTPISEDGYAHEEGYSALHVSED